MRTSDQVRQAAIELISATGDLLDRAFAGNAEAANEPTNAARELDQKLQDLRQAAAPLEWRYLPVSGRQHQELVQAATAAAFFARQLVRAVPRDASERASLQEPARELAASACALAQGLTGQDDSDLRSAAGSLKELEHRLRVHTPNPASKRLQQWLRRTAEELLRASRLGNETILP